jgi:hypothetical protein
MFMGVLLLRPELQVMNATTTSPCPSRSAEEITKLIDQWKASGKSKKAFCSEHGLKYYSFIEWTSKLGLKELRGKRASKELSSPFIPIALSSVPNSNSPMIEISYPGGRKVSFYTHVDVQLLKTLLQP